MLTARQLVSTGLVALTIAGTTIATASQADAHDRFGRGLAAGLIGGAVAATVLDRAYAPPPPVVYGPPVYRPIAVYNRVVGPPHRCHTSWHMGAYGQEYRTQTCRVW